MDSRSEIQFLRNQFDNFSSSVDDENDKKLKKQSQKPLSQQAILLSFYKTKVALSEAETLLRQERKEKEELQRKLKEMEVQVQVANFQNQSLKEQDIHLLTPVQLHPYEKNPTSLQSFPFLTSDIASLAKTIPSLDGSILATLAYQCSILPSFEAQQHKILEFFTKAALTKFDQNFSGSNKEKYIQNPKLFNDDLRKRKAKREEPLKDVIDTSFRDKSSKYLIKSSATALRESNSSIKQPLGSKSSIREESSKTTPQANKIRPTEGNRIISVADSSPFAGILVRSNEQEAETGQGVAISKSASESKKENKEDMKIEKREDEGKNEEFKSHQELTAAEKNEKKRQHLHHHDAASGEMEITVLPPIVASFDNPRFTPPPSAGSVGSFSFEQLPSAAGIGLNESDSNDKDDEDEDEDEDEDDNEDENEDEEEEKKKEGGNAKSNGKKEEGYTPSAATDDISPRRRLRKTWMKNSKELDSKEGSRASGSEAAKEEKATPKKEKRRKHSFFKTEDGERLFERMTEKVNKLLDVPSSEGKADGSGSPSQGNTATTSSADTEGEKEKKAEGYSEQPLTVQELDYLFPVLFSDASILFPKLMNNFNLTMELVQLLPQQRGQAREEGVSRLLAEIRSWVQKVEAQVKGISAEAQLSSQSPLAPLSAASTASLPGLEDPGTVTAVPIVITPPKPHVLSSNADGTVADGAATAMSGSPAAEKKVNSSPSSSSPSSSPSHSHSPYSSPSSSKQKLSDSFSSSSLASSSASSPAVSKTSSAASSPKPTSPFIKASLPSATFSSKPSATLTESDLSSLSSSHSSASSSASASASASASSSSSSSSSSTPPTSIITSPFASARREQYSLPAHLAGPLPSSLAPPLLSSMQFDTMNSFNTAASFASQKETKEDELFGDLRDQFGVSEAALEEAHKEEESLQSRIREMHEKAKAAVLSHNKKKEKETNESKEGKQTQNKNVNEKEEQDTKEESRSEDNVVPPDPDEFETITIEDIKPQNENSTFHEFEDKADDSDSNDELNF
eukprot:MONOS_1062.1-p1 / transcript=MONOS_1062.1 / gene=MONOS_1062 / organism=Monocercomonoides_exilis_PA203 / gene_product=unspecified product / transcript_product=unspecified product / location=Mono_scaffold00018:63543-66779(+) / protein_length=1025 / sequence_SO=supercontig / SO=protein_coding / is_pseudo=false